jgi:hypothetical protein
LFYSILSIILDEGFKKFSPYFVILTYGVRRDA